MRNNRVPSLWLLFFAFHFNQICAQVPKNISLVSTYQFSGQTLAGCWHYEDSSGHVYALVGASHGIAILNIDTPSNPQFLFQLPGITNLWHEVKVQGNYAYAVSEGYDSTGIKNGMQIINLNYLPDSAPYVFYKGDGAILNQLRSAHSVTTAGHFVYINGHNISGLGSGVLICDLTNPMSPQYLGAITQNYCHDSYVRGDTIWTSDIRAGQFAVYNISDRSNPVQLATQETPLLFNHNAWLSDDSRTIFVTDEMRRAPLTSFDVSDLRNITLLDKHYPLHMSTFEAHNVRVHNDFIVSANYGSQLTLVDAMRPANLIEVGNFQTGNSLCWDADPFLSSGLILATDMNSGKFYILQPTYSRACYLEGQVTDSSSGISLSNVAVQIISDSLIKTSNTTGIYHTGIADSGTYAVLFSKTGYQSKIISNIPLNNGIVTTLNVQLVSTGIGISETELNSLILISPNPALSKISIHSENPEITGIRLYDALGKLILSYTIPVRYQKDFHLQLEPFNPGIFSLQIFTNQGMIVKKVVHR